MNDKWRKEKRGDFGWEVEGASEIKALWLATVDFADPNAKVNGKIASSTTKILEQKLAEYAAYIAPLPNLTAALGSGSLMAFGINKKLGGGYLIALAVNMNFQTIATEGVLTNKQVKAFDRQNTSETSGDEGSPTSMQAVQLAELIEACDAMKSLSNFKRAAKLAAAAGSVAFKGQDTSFELREKSARCILDCLWALKKTNSPDFDIGSATDNDKSFVQKIIEIERGLKDELRKTAKRNPDDPEELFFDKDKRTLSKSGINFWNDQLGRELTALVANSPGATPSSSSRQSRIKKKQAQVRNLRKGHIDSEESVCGKTKCNGCGINILMNTAKRTSGYCIPCVRKRRIIGKDNYRDETRYCRCYKERVLLHGVGVKVFCDNNDPPSTSCPEKCIHSITALMTVEKDLDPNLPVSKIPRTDVVYYSQLVEHGFLSDFAPDNNMSESSKIDPKGCFIATVCYRDPLAEELQVFRSFRDKVLLKHLLGRLFVSLYYRFSPPVADFLAERPILAELIRKYLFDVAIGWLPNNYDYVGKSKFKNLS